MLLLEPSRWKIVSSHNALILIMGPWGQWGGRGRKGVTFKSPFYKNSPAEVPFENMAVKYHCSSLLLFHTFVALVFLFHLVVSCFYALALWNHFPTSLDLSASHSSFRKQLQVGLNASPTVSYASRFHGLYTNTLVFCFRKLVQGKECAPCPSKFSIWRFQNQLWMCDLREKYQSHWFWLHKCHSTHLLNFYCLYLTWAKPSFAFA